MNILAAEAISRTENKSTKLVSPRGTNQETNDSTNRGHSTIRGVKYSSRNQANTSLFSNKRRSYCTEYDNKQYPELTSPVHSNRFYEHF